MVIKVLVSWYAFVFGAMWGDQYFRIFFGPLALDLDWSEDAESE